MPRPHCRSLYAGSLKITSEDRPQIERDGTLVDVAFLEVKPGERRIHHSDLERGTYIRTRTGAIVEYDPDRAHGKAGRTNDDPATITPEQAESLTALGVRDVEQLAYAKQFGALLKMTADRPLYEDAYTLAAQYHEEWRRSRLQDDGTYEPRHSDRIDGTLNIAELRFEELPPEIRNNNVTSAVEALAAAAAARSSSSPDAAIEEAAAVIHDQWLRRNQYRAMPFQQAEFSQLRHTEQEKDRRLAARALEMLALRGPAVRTEVDPAIAARLASRLGGSSAPAPASAAPAPGFTDRLENLLGPRTAPQWERTPDREWSNFGERLGVAATATSEPAEQEETAPWETAPARSWSRFSDRLDGAAAPDSQPEPTFNPSRFGPRPSAAEDVDSLRLTPNEPVRWEVKNLPAAPAAPAQDVDSLRLPAREIPTSADSRFRPPLMEVLAATPEATPRPEVRRATTEQQQANRAAKRASAIEGVFLVRAGATPTMEYYIEAGGLVFESHDFGRAQAAYKQVTGRDNGRVYLNSDADHLVS